MLGLAAILGMAPDQKAVLKKVNVRQTTIRANTLKRINRPTAYLDRERKRKEARLMGDDEPDRRNLLPAFEEVKNCCSRGCCNKVPNAYNTHYRQYLLFGPKRRRRFLATRQRQAKYISSGLWHRTFWIDNPRLVADGTTLPDVMDHDIDEPIEVCARFYTFLYAVSNNFIYQPSLPGTCICFADGEGFFFWLICSPICVLGVQQMAVELVGRRQSFSNTTNGIIAWLTDLASYYQVDPSSEKIFLPFYSQRIVWEMYNEDPEVDAPAKRSFFNQVWRENVPHIVIRKWLKFAKCDQCIEFRERRTLMLDAEAKIELQDAERLHVRFVKAERYSYYMRRLRAVRFKLEYLSVIVDGADQQAYSLPYFCTSTHSSDAV